MVVLVNSQELFAGPKTSPTMRAGADPEGHREEGVADWRDVGDVESVDLEGISRQRVERS